MSPPTADETSGWARPLDDDDDNDDDAAAAAWAAVKHSTRACLELEGPQDVVVSVVGERLAWHACVPVPADLLQPLDAAEPR